MDFKRDEFDAQMKTYFSDYDLICWRRHKGIYYCLFTDGAVPSKQDEAFVNSIIDKLLSKNGGRNNSDFYDRKLH
jgi:hypothetical protein